MSVFLTKTRLAGTALHADVAQAVTAATMTMTIEGASTVDLVLADPARKLLRSGIFGSRVTFEVDEFLFELVKVAKQGDRFAVTFEDAAVAELRRHKGVKTVKPGVMTRGGFARQLLAEAPFVKAEVFDSGATAKVALARGSEQDPDQDTWDALAGIADPVGWRRFAYKNVVYLGTDAWLMARRPPALTIREHTGGVDNIDHDTDAGKPASTATVTCRIDRWTIPPGQSVKVEGQGLADGTWLVKQLQRSLFSRQGVVELTRPQVGLPEPVEAASKGSGDDVASAGAAGSGTPVAPGRPSRQGYTWPMSGTITGRFGDSRPGHKHQGVDVAAPTGTPVVAARAGRVAVASTLSGYGLAVYIDHGDGAFTRYGHLSRILVQRGAQVATGDRIGLCGNTGTSSGPHLHFEVLEGGTAIDPLAVLPNRPQRPNRADG